MIGCRAAGKFWIPIQVASFLESALEQFRAGRAIFVVSHVHCWLAARRLGGRGAGPTRRRAAAKEPRFVDLEPRHECADSFDLPLGTELQLRVVDQAQTVEIDHTRPKRLSLQLGAD